MKSVSKTWRADAHCFVTKIIHQPIARSIFSLICTSDPKLAKLMYVAVAMLSNSRSNRRRHRRIKAANIRAIASEREKKLSTMPLILSLNTRLERVSRAEKKVAQNVRREGFSAKLRDYRRHSKLLSRNETFHFNKLSLKPPSPRVQESKSNYQVNYFSFLFSFDC